MINGDVLLQAQAEAEEFISCAESLDGSDVSGVKLGVAMERLMTALQTLLEDADVD